MSSPLLSIGIIFRDDIRCIERCLKALAPLREAIPCELVMADTGSKDGSRAVAEKYADILIDFPWINDFAAARNAVIDHCSGAWYLTVDTDEYLDEDFSQLVKFLAVSEGHPEVGGTVLIRNYNSYEMDGDYSDFMAIRLAKLSLGVRYSGSIHESLAFPPEVEVQLYPLNEVVFHHDGYVGINKATPEGRAKLERNVTLIRERIKESPDNLVLRSELIESAWGEPDYIDIVRDAVALVKQKKYGWQGVGASILRHAVYAADTRNLPELEEWTDLAFSWFPDSMYTRLDVEYAVFVRRWNNSDYAGCVECGERYMKAFSDYRNGADPTARVSGTLHMATPIRVNTVRIFLATAYLRTGKLEKAVEYIGKIDGTLLEEEQTENVLKAIQEIHADTQIETAPMILKLWEELSQPKPSQKRMEARCRAFLKTVGIAISLKRTGKYRAYYSLYAPLRGKCEPGTAAAVLDMEDAREIGAALAEVRNWDAFSVHALVHALKCGVGFPLPEMRMNAEDAESLASRFKLDPEGLFELALGAAGGADTKGMRNLLWTQALVQSAIRNWPWKGGELDLGQGMALSRAFARVERAYLPLCYAQGALNRESLFLLPPLHRFGFYCAQAFDALDGGDAAGYVRLLREGLAVCENVKDMVEFLLEHTPELQVPLEPSAELKTLADQIRAVLSNFAPDDPAVEALKQSEVYQKVAHLIEGIEVPVVGGLPS